MKKTLTVMTLLAGAVSVYSQSVSFNDYGNTAFGIQVWSVQASGNSTSLANEGYAGYTEKTGNIAANSYQPPQNAGSQVYSTANGVIGTGYDAGLYAIADHAIGDTAATLFTQLNLVAVATSWFNNTGTPTDGNYGQWNSTAAPVIAGSATSDEVATVGIAAWKNSGASGAATTLAEAQADGYAWGISSLATVTLATGSQFTPNIPASITDFSMAVSTPEPSTIALGVIGASALLFRRRK